MGSSLLYREEEGMVDYKQSYQVIGRGRAIEDLSKHELEALLTRTRQVLKAKYCFCKRRHVLSGNLSRIFCCEQVLEYFSTYPCVTEDDNNYRCLLLRQFFYGCRVGEVQSMRLLLDQRLVAIDSEKKGEPTTEYLPYIQGTACLWNVTKVYHKNAIARAFVRHVKRLGASFYMVYGSDARGYRRGRYTSHTLRKTAGNLFKNSTGRIEKEIYFLRQSLHRAYGATASYIDYPESEFRADINKCFRHYVEQLL